MTSQPTKALPRRYRQLRRHAGAPGVCAGLYVAEFFSNEVDLGGPTLWIGVGDDGNGNSTSQIAIAGPGFVRPPPAQVTDAAYQMLVTDGGVHFVALTAPRVLTLPSLAAARAAQMRPFAVLDESGNASPTCAIAIQPAGTDTINGIAAGQPGGTILIVAPFQPVNVRAGFTTWVLG